jgi:hypothetical protein
MISGLSFKWPTVLRAIKRMSLDPFSSLDRRKERMLSLSVGEWQKNPWKVCIKAEFYRSDRDDWLELLAGVELLNFGYKPGERERGLLSLLSFLFHPPT